MRGDTERAIADFDAAIKLDGKNAVAFNNRGFAQHTRATPTAPSPTSARRSSSSPHTWPRFTTAPTPISTSATLDRAIKDFNAAIKLNANFAAAYNGRGMAYDDKNQFDLAIEDYSQTIKLDPKNARAYNNRGFAYRNRGDFDRAIADYNQALALDPKYALALYNRAIAYYDKRDFENATRDMNEAIKLNPNFQTAFRDRGTAYFDRRDYDDSIAAAETAKASRPLR